MSTEQPPFDRALATLGGLLAERGLRYELYAVGGGALQLLGLIVRPTKDIDVVGLVERDTIVPARPLPPRCVLPSSMSPGFSVSPRAG